MTEKTTPRVRLVKAVVQLYFNYDDGENLREIQGVRPILIEAKDWPGAVEERSAELVREVEQQVIDLLNEDQATTGQPPQGRS